MEKLVHRKFHGSMIETFKILHSYYDDNCVHCLHLRTQSPGGINFQSGHDNVKLTSEEISLQYE